MYHLYVKNNLTPTVNMYNSTLSGSSKVSMVLSVTSGLDLWLASTMSDSSGFAGPQFLGLALDPAGNVYAAGLANGSGTIGFGNGVSATIAYSGQAALLVKYDSSLTPLWAQGALTSSADSQFNAASWNASNSRLVVAGYEQDTTGFGYGVSSGPGYTGGPSLLALSYRP